MTSIQIPKTITSVNPWAFYGCSNLKKVYITDLKAWLAIDFGSFVASPFQDDTRLYLNDKEVTTLTIPDGTTVIKPEVFHGCKSITKVILPNSVKEIGEYAFCNCNNLQSINIPDAVTTIGQAALSCNNLKTVYINNLSSWLNIDFASFDANPCRYGASLILNGTELRSVTVPSDITVIKPYAFSGCTSITNVTMHNGIKTIGKSSFWGCSRLEDITLSNIITMIEDQTFYGCSSLKQIVIPSTVTSIGGYAFWQCESLKSINIPNSVTSIGQCAFRGCSTLCNISIPESLSSIERETFRDCSSLESIDLPNSVTSIANNAFYNCANLSGTLSLSEAITSIGEEAFNGTSYAMCHIKASTPPTITSKTFGSAMKFVIVPDNYVDSYNNAEIWSDYKIIAESQDQVIDVTVSTPGMLASDIVNQAEIAPKNVTKLVVHGAINETDFKVMKSNMTSCYSIDLIDADCTEIPNEAFKDKDYLMDFKLPNKCTSIGNYAFSGCTALSSIEFPPNLTTIGCDAFCGCSMLHQNIVFPASLTALYANAFRDCKSITSVDFSKTSVAFISITAFDNCTSLQEITLSGTIKDINWAAFRGCKSLSKIRIGWPSSLESVGDYAFQNCSNLPGLNLSECTELTSIGERAFSGCSGMKSLNLSGCTKLTSIGSYAFSECINIPKVDLSACKAITSIGSYAFNGCSSMTTLNLPASLTSVEGYAFQNCTALKNITVPCVTPPAAGAGAFSGVDNNTCALSMPTQSYIDYLTAEHWGAFVEMRKWIEVTEVNGAKDTYGNDMGHIYFSRGNVSASGNQEAKAEPYVLTSTAALGVTGIDAVTDDGMSLYVQANDVVSFAFVPEAGCTLERVYYGGTDVTNQVVNGVFTTPAVSAQTTIRVEFSDGSSTGIEQATQVPFRVYIDGGRIKIEGLKAHTPIQLFTIDGQRVYQGTDTLITPPARGIYMVRAAGHTVKIAL